jgi:hypothetical protein
MLAAFFMLPGASGGRINTFTFLLDPLRRPGRDAEAAAGAEPPSPQTERRPGRIPAR